MDSEEAQDIYKRAIVSFIKHDDEDSAAELYFAVRNLTAHGHEVLHNDEQILLRAQDILEGCGVEDDLIRKKIRTAKEGDVGSLSYIPKYVTARQGRTHNPHQSMEMVDTHRDLTPISLNIDGEPFALGRREWNIIKESEDESLRLDALRALFSYRPESDRIIEPEITIEGIGKTRGEKARSHENVPHPLEHIGWFRSEPYGQGRETSGIERLTRALYSNEDSLPEIDRRRFTHADEYKSYPQQRILGEYGSGSLPQGRLRQIGLEDWEAEWKKRFDGEPDERDFIDHTILRNEGVPSSTIWSMLYDKDGKGGSSERFKASMGMVDSEKGMRLGLLPALLGLEGLPQKQALDILGWFMDGGEGEVPGFEKIQGAEGLFTRMFRERLSVLHHNLTDDLLHNGSHIPHLDSGVRPGGEDIDLSELSPRRWGEILHTVPSDPSIGRGEGKSLLTSILRGSFLPDVRDGKMKKVTDKSEEPVLSHQLLEDYVKAGHITPEQMGRVEELARNDLSIGGARHTVVDGYSALDSPWRPVKNHANHDEDISKEPSAAKVVHDTLRNRNGGGHALGHMDVARFFHEMFPTLFFHRPTDALLERGKEAPIDPKTGKTLDPMGWDEHDDASVVYSRPHHPNVNHEVMGDDDPDRSLNFGPWFGGLAGQRFATMEREPFPDTFARVRHDTRNVFTFDPASHIDSKRGSRREDWEKAGNSDRRDAGDNIARNTQINHTVGSKPSRINDMFEHHPAHLHLLDLLFQMSDPDNIHPEWDTLSGDLSKTLKDMIERPELFESMDRDPMSRTIGQLSQRLLHTGLLTESEYDPEEENQLALYRHDSDNDVLDHGMHVTQEGVLRVYTHMLEYLQGKRDTPPALPDPYEAIESQSDGLPIIAPSIEHLVRIPEVEKLRPLHRGRGNIRGEGLPHDGIIDSIHDLEDISGKNSPFRNLLVTPREKEEILRQGLSGPLDEGTKGYVIGPHPNIITRALLDELSAMDVGDTEPERVQEYAKFMRGLRNQILTYRETDPVGGKTEDNRDYLSRGLMSSYDSMIPIARGLSYLFQQDPRFKDSLDDAENHSRILEAAIEGSRTMSSEGREAFAKQLEEAGYDDEETLKRIRDDETRPWFNTSRFQLDDIEQPDSVRLQDALSMEKEEGALTGADLIRHYIEEHEDDETKKQHGLDFLTRMEEHDGHQSFKDSLSKYHKGNWIRLSKKYIDRGVPVTQFEESEKYHSELGAIGDAIKRIKQDQMKEGSLNLTEGVKLPSDFKPTPTLMDVHSNERQKIQAGKAQRRFYESLPEFLYSRVGLNVGVGGEIGHSRKLRHSGSATALPVDSGRFDSFRPMPILGSIGLSRQMGQTAYPKIDVDFGDGSEGPVIHHNPLGYPRLQTRFPPNVMQGVLGRESPEPKQTSYEGDSAAVIGAQMQPGEKVDLLRSFDALTDLDLLIKEEDERDKGEFLPVKAMHRIFDVKDLEHLRGFSGDWVVSIWPQGERLILEREGDEVKVRDSEGGEHDLPKSTLKGIKEIHDEKDYILDGVWDGEHLHIVDIIKFADEDMENMPTKDRVRHVRATFEANEEVSIPAPVNTRRTDDVGLEDSIESLFKEPNAKQILLRDADATYMMGETRHPKWVLLSPMKKLDVRIVALSGKNARLGVGPIFSDIAEEIGNRSVEYEDEHYMDVGSTRLSEDKEEGDYITVKVDSVTHSERKGHDIYRLNGATFDSDSEAGATDSVETLSIMSGVPDDVPHRIRVTKGNVLINFPALKTDVIYKTENSGNVWLVYEPDAPHDYALKLAESQRPFWEAPAAILLRSEKETKNENEEKAHVEPEPLANHKKKPKKVDEDQFFKRGLITALEVIDRMLKEKSTFTGPKGLGIDFATPIESPSGPTEVINESGLPDYDPIDEHDAPKSAKKKHLKKFPIKTERDEGATLTTSQDESFLDLREAPV